MQKTRFGGNWGCITFNYKQDGKTQVVPTTNINLVYCQHDIMAYTIGGGHQQFLEGHHLTESNTGLASMQ